MTPTTPGQFGTRADRERLRLAYAELASRYPDYFMTIITNRGTLAGEQLSFMSLDMFKDRASDLLKRVDSKLLGSRAYRKPISERTDGLMFVEHVGRNIHGHAVVTFGGSNRTKEQLQAICSEAWAAICPGGEIHLIEQYDGGPGLYPSKEMLRGDYDFDQTVLFSTFVSRQS